MKFGRPSREDLKIVPLPVADRVQPPDNLSVKEARLFREVVLSCPPRQFGLADVYLLVSFVRCTMIAERASRQLGKARSARERASWMKMLNQATKLQAQLATKLRLTTTSRHDVRKRVNMLLKPTQLPPMYANEDNLNHYDERDRQAARLLRKMRMAGLSRYEPNPKAALAKAKRDGR
jgi:hypothetical protein